MAHARAFTLQMTKVSRKILFVIVQGPIIRGKHTLYYTLYNILALTRKICGILSKKLQKLALFKYYI